MSCEFTITSNGNGELVAVLGSIEIHAAQSKGGKSAVKAFAGGALAHTDRVDLVSQKQRGYYANSLFTTLQESELPNSPDELTLRRLLLALSEALQNKRPEAPKESDAEKDARQTREIEGALAASCSLLECPALLWHVADVLVDSGLAGERRNALLLYLAVTGRVQDHINSIVIKGPSSVGKNTLVRHVLNLFPPNAFYITTGLSERALIYSPENFQHRFVIIEEATGMGNDNYLTLLIRCLLSEGHIRYDTVERLSEEEGGGVQGVVIEKEGPTGLITTTKGALYEDMETRMLSVTVRDDAAQSRAVLEAIAKARSTRRQKCDLSEWTAMQQWIELAGIHQVTIPFAPRLAALVPVSAVRVRRDFSQLLDLITASAILHQRQRSAEGDCIVATLADYSIVRGLLADVWEAVQQDGLTPTQRETVETVRAIYEERMSQEESDRLVTHRDIAARLNLDRSAVSRRLSNPLRLGYVTNEESRKYHPAKLKPGAPLPDAAIPLPTPSELAELTGLPTSELDPGNNLHPPQCRCGRFGPEFLL